MNQKSIYITVRIDLESNDEITEEMVQDVVSELDYEFSSGIGGVPVIGTEICGINE